MAKSASSSSSAISSYQKKYDGPLCHCSRRTTKAKAWTDDNPGRRFLLCESHGFVVWADKEEQNGWQKQSLLEARDLINRQRDEIKGLKESLRSTSQEATIGDSTALLLEEGDKLAEKKTKLEIALITSAEKEKLLRQFLYLSWGGFIAITTIVVFGLLKK